ncbi:tRNA lysidine(34) synthetase TilS [Dermatophilus congolensis]|uniref:tRNA(Ile)-lysidine synthase n=1 Tax=Dermatophilus congolensis TaxID=1863 RepID=A0A239VAS2_9MICO|nr:tRNA lysidine(34) synthetase TilS [Dermatophilus congolensis]MBO3130676.1 tRNA lysidine(34) synthetase TilS [Dermatophilus congolensis]MBO3130694.1 tRNA lysidine(34) synthetase TilS [Dermatophilus congolensis]MBO3135149.1 tRNA lysidine(34) synthetase TilS [Dermatophilus congolensis]MBO3137388.1 tRNA lysidine(34) synthetase TilS [Dermatophilus congolensis]MBO3139629.1 tRNA lysidine(34) synthetase TilS [Dermatophilus congolensis]
MTGPHPAVAAIRLATRTTLATIAHQHPNTTILVACSGGPDSLALAAAAAFEAPRLGLHPGAVIIDHALQPNSHTITHSAATTCTNLGLHPVITHRVDTTTYSNTGPEAAARAARYTAFEATATSTNASAILLAHTQHDQAEQVLLGLLRGSGARSLAGMPPHRDLYHRPLLNTPAHLTHDACAALNLTPWHDPHNTDPRYTRVRTRELLDTIATELGPGIIPGLARTAELLRTDADTLDTIATHETTKLGPPPWDTQKIAELLPGIRRRVWRQLATTIGAPHGALTSTHVNQLDALITNWHGQGGVHLPGGHVITRTGTRVGPVTKP